MSCCLSDSGYKNAERIRSDAVENAALARQIAAGVIAIDNANRVIENYRDQRDLSQRTIAIAQQQQQQIETVYWPREAQFLNEFANPEPVEDVEVMGVRYAGRLVSSVANAFAMQLREARCSFRRYCTSANKKLIQDLMLARGAAIANARVLGRNIAFAEFQARTDLNFNRRMQAVALGRGLINEAMTLYQAAGRGLANAGADLSLQLNSALEAFGSARSDRIAARDYVPPPFFNTESDARLPGIFPSNGGESYPGFVSFQDRVSFGLNSSQTSMFGLQAPDLMDGDNTGLSSTSQPNVFVNSQHEMQMNRGRVGNQDLIRTGVVQFPVIGGPGVVNINIERFGLKYADDLTEGPGSLV